MLIKGFRSHVAQNVPIDSWLRTESSLGYTPLLANQGGTTSLLEGTNRAGDTPTQPPPALSHCRPDFKAYCQSEAQLKFPLQHLVLLSSRGNLSSVKPAFFFFLHLLSALCICEGQDFLFSLLLKRPFHSPDTFFVYVLGKWLRAHPKSAEFRENRTAQFNLKNHPKKKNNKKKSLPNYLPSPHVSVPHFLLVSLIWLWT